MKLGKNIETGQVVKIDLNILLRSRLLLQASSGGGKSYTAKRIMEQTHDSVQHIVIDTEGEFSTLREQFDYLLVGPEGDISANINSAGILAEKIMKLKISTIIDLSDFTKSEKCNYIQKFLNSLMELDRSFWNPCLIFIDEAHDFAPEGRGASKEAVKSKHAIASLCSKGRKRRFCPVLMSQRISKLSKDAAAECQNKLTGMTTLDIDRKRASDELGFNKDQERRIRDLEPGEFYAFGPAISREVIKVKVSKIKTSHEEEDGEICKVIPVPENIAKMLKDLNNLDEEAKVEAKTKEDMQKRISDLEIQLKTRKIERVPVKEIDQEAIDRAVLSAEQRIERKFKAEISNFTKNNETLKKGIEQITTICSKLLQIEIPVFATHPTHIRPTSDPHPTKRLVTKSHQESPRVTDLHMDNIVLGLCAKKLYSFLAYKADRKFTRAQIGAATGYKITSGGFKNAISQLRTSGLVEGSSELQAKVVDENLMGNFDFSIQAIVDGLGKCEREIFNVLRDNPNREFEADELAAETPTNYSPTSGGYKNALSRLKTLGLINKNGTIKLHEEMLEII